MMSKSLSWSQHVMTWTSQKYVKILSWSQNFMTSKKIAMTFKRRHDLNKFVMMSKHTMTSKSSLCYQKVRHYVKNMLWWQNVRHCFKTSKGLSWRQKVCHHGSQCGEILSHVPPPPPALLPLGYRLAQVIAKYIFFQIAWKYVCLSPLINQSSSPPPPYFSNKPAI